MLITLWLGTMTKSSRIKLHSIQLWSLQAMQNKNFRPSSKLTKQFSQQADSNKCRIRSSLRFHRCKWNKKGLQIQPSKSSNMINCPKIHLKLQNSLHFQRQMLSRFVHLQDSSLYNLIWELETQTTWVKINYKGYFNNRKDRCILSQRYLRTTTDFKTGDLK